MLQRLVSPGSIAAQYLLEFLKKSFFGRTPHSELLDMDDILKSCCFFSRNVPIKGNVKNISLSISIALVKLRSEKSS